MVIKLMADYECSPLWLTSSDGSRNLRLGEVPISVALAADLQEWADQYDRTLNREDPTRSGFSTPDLALRFAKNGEELARRLALELGDDWVVNYFDETIGAVRRIS